ncbi:hypothetical protein KP509_33G058400 [Ceratopteris richardii]|uniref:Uncharacterized protein n=1 Tax=Ceratopteris richardii TaxID=49495 RepID=A0A8T2QRV3_CERRI|nr:hypothetical protein KP509_33G058400 [Ceratopteris richardii]
MQAMLGRVEERLPTGKDLSVIGECMPHYSTSNWDQLIPLDLVPRDSEENLALKSPQVEGGSSKAKYGHYLGGVLERTQANVNSTKVPRVLNGSKISKEFHKELLRLDTWMQISIIQCKSMPCWIPQVHKLRVQGSSCISDFHVHLILYDQPKLGSHHFSMQPWSFLSNANEVREHQLPVHPKPDWILELQKREEAPDIDSVILQLNCAVAAEHYIKSLVTSCDRPFKRPSLNTILTRVFTHIVAATIALFATTYFTIIQAGCCILRVWPFMHLNLLLAKFMKHSHQNIRIRCHELIGWPDILLPRGCGRDQPNIAVAHRTALIRHSTWSAIIFDLVFGLVWGAIFLSYRSAIGFQIRVMFQSLTDDLLRTGCIWLMGVPAGFKLNTELAGMLGLFSLNVIQVWSTLVYLLKPLFGPFLYMLALSGMILGITVPAAIIADMLFLVTFHISTLHQLVAFIYSNQLQALAALWRLFRGRKRNALRGRIDTYDCNVEQHVVGSLMFTPLLLLLPTTSVFYIFFTMLFSSLSILRLLLQIFIAIVHCFPYAQVAIWLVQPRRFPSGIWFETLPEVVDPQQDAIHPSKRRNKQRGKKKGSVLQVVTGNLVTVLGINTASIGEILIPSLRQLGGGVTWSSCAFCIYKIFSGERWPASVELGMPVLPPWTTCNIRGFWRLCYDAIIASI